MEKILSIIIPTYNMEELLPGCLDSLIVEDNLDNLEVWVVNDGSKDLSSEIGHKYSKKYPGVIKIIDKPNGNYGSCINAALPKCTGKYVKVLDSDDWVLTDNLNSLIQIMSNIESDIIVTDYDYISGNKLIRTESYDLPKNELISFRRALDSNHFINIQMHAVSYNRKIFQMFDYKQTEGISYTDQEWVFLPMANCNSLYYFNRVVYQYNVGRGGQTMERGQIIKNYSALMRTTLSLVYSYEREKTTVDIDGKEFLIKRLTSRVLDRYRQCLITYTKYLEMDDILFFDQELKEHAFDVYELTDKTKLGFFLGYKYIRAWRNGGGVMYSTIVSICRLVNNVRVKLGKFL